MKIRTGFVSNSSTSSFCLYGAYVSPKLIKRPENTDEEDWYPEYGAEKIGLKCHYCYDDFVMGLSPSRLRDDETGAQFKARINDLIQQMLIENTPLEIHFIEGEYAC
jgi:hypothetical protein